MYNHNKAQQSKNRVHISWDILYVSKIYLSQWGAKLSQSQMFLTLKLRAETIPQSQAWISLMLISLIHVNVALAVI